MEKCAHNSIRNVLLIGMGRIGLPQSLTLADNGINVYGFDQNPATIDMLKRGETPFYEESMDDSLKKNLNKHFFPLSNWQELTEHAHHIDAILFTVGTQVLTSQEILDKTLFNLTKYFTLLDKLFSSPVKLKKGIKLIIRTTLPLGSTDILKDYLEKTHSLYEGKDFYLAFVPERVTEGCTMKELRTVPKIIGVYSEAAFEPIKELFKNKEGKIIRVRNPITAEFCKLTDNSFRSTIFSFANDIAMHASHLDVDVEEVINVVNDHYQRNNIPLPGFVSGYCLGKDPYIFELGFLNNREGRDFHSVWYYGRKTNDFLVDFVVEKVLAQLKNKEKSCVAILGLSFKENIDDFRMSHSLKIIEKLISSGIKRLNIYDPYLNKNKYTMLPEAFLPYVTLEANTIDQDVLAEVDAAIFCVRHQALLELNHADNLAKLFSRAKKPCYLFDGWDSWEEAIKVKEIRYEGIGFKKHPRPL